jgi:RHS repeat-associated protein
MVSDPPAGAAYTYDGNGLRLKKAISAGTTTVYIFSGSRDIAEYDNGAVPSSPTRENIYAGGQLLATITGGSTPTTTYYHPDHLSVRLSTDGTSGSPTYGQVIGQQGHFPFGEAWYSSSTTTKWMFTTYERDAESGLDYALARYYDSSAARFCSADPLGGQPEDAQSWNRYAYVRNDPANLIDPSGKGWLSWLVKIFFFIADLFTGDFGSAAGQAATFGQEAVDAFNADTGTFLGETVFTTVTVTATASTFSTEGAILAGGLAGAAAALGAPQPQNTQKQQAKKPNCPPVPKHPAEADLDTNIQGTQHNGFQWWKPHIDHTGALWDYKNFGGVKHPEYDEFGNFNFGATGAALGIPGNALLRGAGYAKGLSKFGGVPNSVEKLIAHLS